MRMMKGRKLHIAAVLAVMFSASVVAAEPASPIDSVAYSTCLDDASSAVKAAEQAGRTNEDVEKFVRAHDGRAPSAALMRLANLAKSSLDGVKEQGYLAHPEDLRKALGGNSREAVSMSRLPASKTELTQFLAGVCYQDSTSAPHAHSAN